jgi:hypothetical protein
MRFNIFLLLIIIIPLASTTPALHLQHEDITKHETILAILNTSGKFQEGISPLQISFFEERKKIFIESNLILFNNNYYIYIYPTRQGNFTLKIEGILYSDSNDKNFKEKTIEKEIEIKDSNENSSILSIKPGFIFSTGNAQKITLTNKGKTNLEFTYLGNKSNLSVDSSTEILPSLTKNFSYLEIKTYKTFRVPIIYQKINNQNPNPLPPKETFLKSNLLELTAELTENTEQNKNIQLFNFGDGNITDIKITSSVSFLKAFAPENIEPNSAKNFSITLTPKNSGQVKGNLNITYTQSNSTNILSLPLNLFILPKGSTEEDFKISSETCTQKNGTICSSNEFCTGKSGFAKDGYCCLAVCKPLEKDDEGSGIGWIFGIIIFLVLAAVGYLLYKKSKKIKPKKPEDKLKEAATNYSKRISGGLRRS